MELSEPLQSRKPKRKKNKKRRQITDLGTKKDIDPDSPPFEINKSTVKLKPTLRKKIEIIKKKSSDNQPTSSKKKIPKAIPKAPQYKGPFNLKEFMIKEVNIVHLFNKFLKLDSFLGFEPKTKEEIETGENSEFQKFFDRYGDVKFELFDDFIINFSKRFSSKLQFLTGKVKKFFKEEKSEIDFFTKYEEMKNFRNNFGNRQRRKNNLKSENIKKCVDNIRIDESDTESGQEQEAQDEFKITFQSSRREEIQNLKVKKEKEKFHRIKFGAYNEFKQLVKGFFHFAYNFNAVKNNNSRISVLRKFGLKSRNKAIGSFQEQQANIRKKVFQLINDENFFDTWIEESNFLLEFFYDKNIGIKIIQAELSKETVSIELENPMRIIKPDKDFMVNLSWAENEEFLKLLTKLKSMPKKWQYQNMDDLCSFDLRERVLEMEKILLNQESALYHQIDYYAVKNHRNSIHFRKSENEIQIVNSKMFLSSITFERIHEKLENFHLTEKRFLSDYNMENYRKAKYVISSVAASLGSYPMGEVRSMTIENLSRLAIKPLLGLLLRKKHATMISSAVNWCYGVHESKFQLENFARKFESFLYQLSFFYAARGAVINTFLALESISDIPTHPILLRFFKYLQDNFDFDLVFEGKFEKFKTMKFAKIEAMLESLNALEILVYMTYHYKIDPLSLNFLKLFVIEKFKNLSKSEKNKNVEKILFIASSQWDLKYIAPEIIHHYLENHRLLYVNHQIPASLRKILFTIEKEDLWRLWCKLVKNNEVTEFMSYKGTSVLVYKLINTNFFEISFTKISKNGNTFDIPFGSIDHIEFMKSLAKSGLREFIKKVKEPYIFLKLLKSNDTLKRENQLFELGKEKDVSFRHQVDREIAEIVLRDFLEMNEEGGDAKDLIFDSMRLEILVYLIGLVKNFRNLKKFLILKLLRILSLNIYSCYQIKHVNLVLEFMMNYFVLSEQNN